jgi:hypothetical protein
MGELIINDRRGQKKEPRQDPAILAPADKPRDASSWLNVAFLIVFAPGPQGVIPIGRAVGLRSDDETFIADWQMPPIWPEGLDWTKVVRARLDTFLNCGCGTRELCATHKHYLVQWKQADAERLNAVACEPLPAALERLMMAERASQPMVVPVGAMPR